MAEATPCPTGKVQFGIDFIFNDACVSDGITMPHYNYAVFRERCMDSCPPLFVNNAGVCDLVCPGGGDVDENNLCIDNGNNTGDGLASDWLKLTTLQCVRASVQSDVLPKSKRLATLAVI